MFDKPEKDDFSNESFLISCLKQNHLPAFKYLYQLYTDALYTIIITIAGDEHVSAKALQETFLQIRSKIHSYNFNISLFSWMHTIARRCAIDAVKPQLKKTKHPIDDFTHNSAYMHGLRKCINSLPPDLKEIMELRYYRDDTVEQIAVKLNLPAVFIKDKLRSALILIHKSISKKSSDN